MFKTFWYEVRGNSHSRGWMHCRTFSSIEDAVASAGLSESIWHVGVCTHSGRAYSTCLVDELD